MTFMYTQGKHRRNQRQEGNPHGDREGILNQKFYPENRVQPIYDGASRKLQEKFLQIDKIDLVSTAGYRKDIWITEGEFGVELVTYKKPNKYKNQKTINSTNTQTHKFRKGKCIRAYYMSQSWNERM